MQLKKTKSQTEYKNSRFEFKEKGKSGEFEGYAAVFDNVDDHGDILDRHAFDDTISRQNKSGGMVKMLWQHSPSDVIGVWDKIKIDDRGLFVKGRVLESVEKGRETLALMRAGALDAMSIGYRTTESEKEGTHSTIRRLLKVDLWEISIVTFPANTLARVTDVKNMDNIRDLETTLRDAGLSQKEAKALLADGFKGLKRYRDDDGADQGDKDIQSLFDNIKKLQESLNV